MHVEFFVYSIFLRRLAIKNYIMNKEIVENYSDNIYENKDVKLIFE